MSAAIKVEETPVSDPVPPPAVPSPVPKPADSNAGSSPSNPVAATNPSEAPSADPKKTLPVVVAPTTAIARTSPVPVVAPLSPNSASKAVAKSKKKKSLVTVTMATAATAQTSSPGAAGENTGRWTAEEHRLFLQGLEQHGKGWKKIASLIKSRTVVQIRTHAQKYFQKLAKARQNGEEGDVAMEGRGGAATVAPVASSATQTNRRRRQTSGTKRKAIQSVVASAQRQGKKIALAQASNGMQDPVPPLPAVAPALSHYVVPPQPPPHTSTAVTMQSCVPSITTAQGTISGPALEDSL